MRCGAYSALTAANADTRAQHQPYMYAPGSRHRYVRDSACVCHKTALLISFRYLSSLERVGSILSRLQNVGLAEQNKHTWSPTDETLTVEIST